MIFYAGYQKDKVKDLEVGKTELDLVTLNQIVSNLPELKCSEQNSITQNCYDLVNIEVLNESMPTFLSPNNPYTRLYYIQLLKNSIISVSKYNEHNDSFTNYTIYNLNEDNYTDSSYTSSSS